MEDVADFRGGPYLGDVVDIGEDWQACVLFYFCEDAEALFQLRAAEGGDGGAIGFVVGGFEDVRDFQLGGDGGDFFGHGGGVGFGLDYAGASDQEERGVWAELDIGD